MRVHVRKKVARKLFKKAANRTNVKNLPSKHNMMRGGYHL